MLSSTVDVVVDVLSSSSFSSRAGYTVLGCLVRVNIFVVVEVIVVVVVATAIFFPWRRSYVACASLTASAARVFRQYYREERGDAMSFEAVLFNVSVICMFLACTHMRCLAFLQCPASCAVTYGAFWLAWSWGFFEMAAFGSSPRNACTSEARRTLYDLRF